MTFTLHNIDYLPTGIFGVLVCAATGTSWLTLQHAYLDGSGYFPKVPPGDYKCIRGEHLLDHSDIPFSTFEIMGVTGHTGILIHPGNTEADSEGCVLLGMTRNGDQGILQSRIAFEQFMAQCSGLNEIDLVVS